MGNVQRESLNKICDSEAFNLGREIARKKRCNGCLVACSDLENYRMPEEKDFKVKKIKYMLIKKFNFIYQIYCLERLKGILRKIENKVGETILFRRPQ